MYIKICGITKLDQAQEISKMGVDALGFICVPSSPRYINASAIGQITSNLASSIKEIDQGLDKVGQNVATSISSLDFVGVFLNESAREICQTVKQGGLNAVQLHGDESPEFCREVRSHLDEIKLKNKPRIKLIKALRIKNQVGLAQAQLFDEVVDAILLDAYDPQMAGGTGKTIDWQMLQAFRPKCPWLLAGGLSPDNVADAIALMSPDGLDISSGVEHSAGNKDLIKVKKFMSICKI